MPDYYLTIYIADINALEEGGESSVAGHIWYSISNGTTSTSYGFAPIKQSSPSGPGSVISTDNETYLGDGQSPYFTETVQITEGQYDLLQGFGADPVGFSTSYNFQFNNCIDFVWAALKTIGIQEPTHLPGAAELPRWNKSLIISALQAFSQSNNSSSGSPTNAYYYIVQTGDTLNSIANYFDLSSQTLQQINAPFSDSTLFNGGEVTIGGLVHVPLAAPIALSADGVYGSLSLPPSGMVYVLDPSSGELYTVGANLDGGDTGSLIVDTPSFGGYATFGAGTYTGAGLAASGNVEVALVGLSNDPLGTLSFNPATGVGTLTLPDGLAIQILGGTALHLTDPTETPDQTLLEYLSQLGDPLTATQLDQDNFNYLNPSGTAYTIPIDTTQPNENDTAANVYYDLNNIAPGAVISGQSTASISYFDTNTDKEVQSSVPATNVLLVAGGIDISQDTISNVQVLDLDGEASLTAGQFDSFSDIEGGGGLTFTTAGTFSLVAGNIDPSADIISLTATDLGGTTLIGNDEAGQSLTASSLGDDTLIAGNGTGDTLTAGEGNDTLTGGNGSDWFSVGGGVDTVTGGNGNDTFYLTETPAVGTTITGGGGADILESADLFNITGITITGVQALDASLTLTIAQLTEFSTIEGGEDISDTAANIEDGLSVLMADANNIDSVVPTDTPVAMSVATYSADQAIIDDFTGGVAIVDTAANIENELANPNDYFDEYWAIASITAIDTSVSVSVAKLSSVLSTEEWIALDKITDGFVVADTAANIEAGLPTFAVFSDLSAESSYPGGIFLITATDAPVTVPVDDVLAYQTVLDLIVGGYDISDTAADVADSFDTLEADVINIQSIKFTDPGTPILDLTPAQRVLDGNLLAKIVGPYQLGGATSGVVVSRSNSPYDVASGQVDIGDTVRSGGIEVVSSGGITGSALVSGGGALVILSGGFAQPTTISSGGTLLVSAGGTSFSATISSGGSEYISFGGFDSGTTLMSGGLQYIEVAATASNTTISGGGAFVYGSAVNVTLENGAAFDIVGSGGTALDTTVSSGANEFVFSGGLDQAAMLSGGTQYVSSGGLAAGTTVTGGGLQYVEAGGTASSTNISGGGAFVYGSAVSMTLENGATFGVIAVSGFGSAATISAGANEYVFSGATDKAATVIGGVQNVSSGGLASGTVLSGGGLQYVFAGGTASNTTISGGGAFVYGSAVSMTLMNGAAFGVIATGGSASGTVVSNGAYEYVFSGATETAARVIGGVENVSSGAVASGAVLSAGGVQSVFAGGTASNTTISGGGLLDYGSTVSMTLANGAAFAIVGAGGVASGTTISTGADEYVFSGAIDRSASVTGGIQNVSSGATASNATLVSGGVQYVFAGGTASNTIISGGGEFVYGGAISTTVKNAAGFAVIESGGIDSGTTVSSGANEYVFSGGTDQGTTLIGGGAEYVSAGGTASSTIVAAGGLFDDGSASNVTVKSAAGFALVESGGVATNITVSSGANAYVSSGGTDSGATLSGGDIELKSGAHGTGTYTFAAGGLLTLDGTGTYGMLVAGFTSASAEIDFSAIASAGASLSWTQQGTSGTLTLSNGANSALVLLLGTYVASNFNTASAPGGGTIVYDPPLTNQVSAGGSAVITPPHAG